MGVVDNCFSLKSSRDKKNVSFGSETFANLVGKSLFITLFGGILGWELRLAQTRHLESFCRILHKNGLKMINVGKNVGVTINLVRDTFLKYLTTGRYDRSAPCTSRKHLLADPGEVLLAVSAEFCREEDCK